MITLRSLLFYFGYAASAFVFGTISLFLWVLPISWRYRILLPWNHVVLAWLRLTCGIKVKVTDYNEGRLEDGPYVILSKHQTSWETLFLQLYFKPLSTILKRSLLFIPFFGWGVALLRPIGIDRSSPVKALRQVKVQGVDRLSRGFNLLIFPEGTRTSPGKPGNYARSGVEVAAAAGVKAIPVAHNAGEVWPARTLRKYPGTIQVVIGKPVETVGRDSREVIAEIRDWIEGELSRMEPARRCTKEELLVQ